jgi:hypothetical protein
LEKITIVAGVIFRVRRDGGMKSYHAYIDILIRALSY